MLGKIKTLNNDIEFILVDNVSGPSALQEL